MVCMHALLKVGARRKKPRSLECQAEYFGLYSVDDGKPLEGLDKGDDPNLSHCRKIILKLWRADGLKGVGATRRSVWLFESSKQEMRGRENQHDFKLTGCKRKRII